MQAETKFKERVLDDLETLKYAWVLKTQERARKGVPDIIACIRGKFVAIELKVDKKKAEPLQEYNIKEIREAKGLAFESSPSRWDEHFKILQEI